MANIVTISRGLRRMVQCCAGKSPARLERRRAVVGKAENVPGDGRDNRRKRHAEYEDDQVFNDGVIHGHPVSEDESAAKRSFAEGRDTGMILTVPKDMWQRLPQLKPLRVGVALAGLVPEKEHQPDLEKPRNAKLVEAIDASEVRQGIARLWQAAPAQRAPRG
jgi:hypothetical protein